jgi:hypothetical protein
MMSDLRLIIGSFKRRESVCALALAAATGLGLVGGCIINPQHPSATQPATETDLATTQPYYWFAKPPAAQVHARDFETIWTVCKQTARDYLFTLERTDFRSGVITTAPLISKQWFEPWRPDTGTVEGAFANSLGAIRRSLRFEITRNPDESYTIIPKVLIERESILERHVTDVSQYRYAFSGPATKIPAREAVTLEPDTYPDVPIKYWYPTGRDTNMEIDVAQHLRKALERSQSIAGAGGGKENLPTVVQSGTPLVADGLISGIAADGTLFINLGLADKIVPGMTFEVYTSRATLPTLSAYAAVNPQSKGWIEVVSVGNGRSTCIVSRQTGPTPPKQGDQIFNFIFQRGSQNHFALAGDFAGNNRDTLVNLIKRWNGVIDSRVGSETDYLILGNAPNQAAARQFYDNIKSQAEQLKIPSLDEDRFNLLIRYYNPAK